MEAATSGTSLANHSVLPTVSQLPDVWIDRLFSRLSAMYGSKFADLWRGSDLHEVKSLWAEKLAGFYEMPDCIKSALDACDEKPWPPTLPEFIALCRDSAKRKSPKRLLELEAPKADPERVKSMMSGFISQFRSDGTYDCKAWAKELKRLYLAGEQLLFVQIVNASEALGETWENGECRSRKVV